MKTFFEKTALCLIALLMLCPAGLSAQKNGKNADISKYLAGAVPVENGVVVFRKSYKAEGKTKEQLASEGLSEMEKYLGEIGLVMNISDLGVTEDMIEGIADSTLIMTGGYKVLTRDEIITILRESM